VHALADLPDAELVITGGPDKAGLAKNKARQDLMRMANTPSSAKESEPISFRMELRFPISS
jgi:hypothetical protein